MRLFVFYLWEYSLESTLVQNIPNIKIWPTDIPSNLLFLSFSESFWKCSRTDSRSKGKLSSLVEIKGDGTCIQSHDSQRFSGLKHTTAGARRINRTQRDTINIQTSILVTSLLSSGRCCQMSSKGVKVYPRAEWCSRKPWRCKALSGSFCMCHYRSLVCWLPVCISLSTLPLFGDVVVSALCSYCRWRAEEWSESPRSWRFTLFPPRLYLQQMIRGHHLEE